MSVKRSTFRAIAVALAALAVAGTAPAKAAKKKDKNTGPEKSGGMMEESGKDPAQTETEDDAGDFLPGKKKDEKKAAQSSEGGEIGAAGTADASATPEEEKPKKKEPPPPRKTIGVFAEGLLGVGRAPRPGQLNPDTNDNTTGPGTSFALMVGGHYDTSTSFRLMLRVPWTIGTVRNNGRDASTNALGNPELAARLRLSQPGDMEWAVRLGVGIPIAQGNTDYIGGASDAAGVAQNYLQRFADASNGWHDQELYAMKRLPITPALLFSWRSDRLRVNGELKSSVMPKIGGSITSTAGGTLSLPAVAWNVLLGGSASYEVFEHAHVALAAWARYGFIEQVDYNGGAGASVPSPFQLVIEPKILAQLGHVVPSVGFVLPIGGQLGGDIWGLRLHVDVIF
jgi:hypothetical protein